MRENLDPNWLGKEEDEIYRENILDHFKNPRNFGKIENPSVHHKEFNPVCGDLIEIFLKVNNDKIEDVKFAGKGCAISMASSSMLTEKINGMSLTELKSMKEDDILEMIGVPLGHVRKKCGLLSLKTIKNGIYNMEVENE